MKTRVMDMTDPNEVEAALIAYYLLYSEDLQCIQQKTTPETEYLTNPRVIVVCAYDDEGIRGVCMVDNDAVLFPVLSGDYVETLRALILGAYEANGGYLEAYTENELILESALAMGIEGVQREGNRIWWGERQAQVAEWGANR